MTEHIKQEQVTITEAVLTHITCNRCGKVVYRHGYDNYDYASISVEGVCIGTIWRYTAHVCFDCYSEWFKTFENMPEKGR